MIWLTYVGVTGLWYWNGVTMSHSDLFDVMVVMYNVWALSIKHNMMSGSTIHDLRILLRRKAKNNFPQACIWLWDWDLQTLEEWPTQSHNWQWRFLSKGWCWLFLCGWHGCAYHCWLLGGVFAPGWWLWKQLFLPWWGSIICATTKVILVDSSFLLYSYFKKSSWSRSFS